MDIRSVRLEVCVRSIAGDETQVKVVSAAQVLQHGGEIARDWSAERIANEKHIWPRRRAETRQRCVGNAANVVAVERAVAFRRSR